MDGASTPIERRALPHACTWRKAGRSALRNLAMELPPTLALVHAPRPDGMTGRGRAPAYAGKRTSGLSCAHGPGAHLPLTRT